VLDIQAEQYDLGQPYVELYEAVADLKRRHDLHPCAVRPRDGLAMRRDSEREVVQELVKRFRSLPAEQQRRLPALLNSLAQLQVVVGDLETSQHDFQEVAALVSDPVSQAEAHHNVYLAALERRDMAEALAALRRAVALDAEALEPFPMARYEPERILGAGGFGVTFLCADKQAGTKVVVKALRGDSLERDTATIFREFGWLQDLDHPALIRLRHFDYAGPEQRRPYVVMDHFEGQTLAEYVAQNGALAPDDWFEIAWIVARALQAAHGRGVLHRSLRPGAVVLRREKGDDGNNLWRVKVLDAGLSLKRAFIHAAASHAAARVQTALGRSVARTVAYAPPEVVGKPKGQVWVGPHSDVYGFGRLCCFALTARPDPDAGDRVILSEGWADLLDAFANWVQAKRPEHFGLVLDRLSHLTLSLPGSGSAADRIGRIEREMYESTVRDHSATLETDPENVAAYVNRGNAFARQGDYARAIADFTEALNRKPVPQPSEPAAQTAADSRAALFRRRALAHLRNGTLREAIADYTEAVRLEPRNLEAHANRAMAFAQLQEHDHAIADYTEAIHLNPKDPTLVYNRGNAHHAKREYDQAVADYTEAVRLDARYLWAYGNRGKTHATRGDFGKAVADFTRVLQLDPNNIRARCDRALAHSDRGDHAQALADYTEALKVEPNPAIYNDRGLLHLRLGDFEQALADFTEAIAHDPNYGPSYMCRGNAYSDRGELDKALADLSEAVRLNPQSPAAHYNRGNVCARLGDFEQALADFNRTVELDPNYAAAYFNRGNTYAEMNAHDEAVADFTTVLKLEPQDAGALTNRGNSYVALGDYARALEDYDAAVALDPNDALTFVNRGNTHARLGRDDKALADYAEALRLDPANARAYSHRGNLHADRGDLEQAIADYTEAVRVDPNSAAAYHGRANAHAERGELEAALADFTETIRLRPDYAAVYYNRANIYADLGDAVRAVADYTEALRLAPGRPGALNNRGNAYRRLGRDDEALADFTAAVAADPNYAMAYYNRAVLLADRGENEAALADYAKALELAPDDLAAYHARGRLYARLGQHGLAVADNEAALRVAPDDPRTCNNLAWLLATCPQDALRDPGRAVKLAQKACEGTGWQDVGSLDTLASALAANGRFAEAVEQQSKVLELAREEDRADYRVRLELYKAGQPYLEA
jgi:tetratricopeptide (TPR) repeat protein